MIYSFSTISVNNLEESIKFYTDVLNLEVAVRFSPGPGVEIAFLKDAKGNKIELIKHGPETTESNYESKVSLGFNVDHFDETMKMVKEKNLRIVRGPVETPAGVKFVYISDPNGVAIEFIQGFNL